MVRCGPISRGELPVEAMTIREKALLEIFSALLIKGVGGVRQTLDKAEESTAYYLQAIDGGSLAELLDAGKTEDGPR